MEELNLDKTKLRKFGITMGIFFLIITFIILLKNKEGIIPASILSIIFIILAVFAWTLLRPLYIFWMRLAFILAWINTRLILSILFYLVFTPIGIGMRLFGGDLLDKKIEKNKESYWVKKEKTAFKQSDYERQF
ncbi:MAG: SxtJ family membrane protein [Candidatus Omnitrophica bacterium]|nr:SxtJ family membrane protein [Candidatus Omnitrophota bacterium]